MKSKCIDVTIPGLRLVSEANQRENPFVRARRAKAQKSAVTLVLRQRLMGHDLLPARVSFTRIAPGRLDSDNAVGSCKHVRDAVAALLGVNDADDAAVEWVMPVTQVRDGAGIYGLKIRIERRGT